jgi:hypothetical protein
VIASTTRDVNGEQTLLDATLIESGKCMSRGQVLPVLVLVRVSVGCNMSLQGLRLRHQLDSGASTSILGVIGQLRARMTCLPWCEKMTLMQEVEW